MKITFTIVVTEAENISIRTQAEDISRSEARPALVRAVVALQAELDALDECPWHNTDPI